MVEEEVIRADAEVETVLEEEKPVEGEVSGEVEANSREDQPATSATQEKSSIEPATNEDETLISQTQIADE